MEKNTEKRKYIKPEIILEKQIETLALVCDSQWNGFQPCMKQGSCGAEIN